MILAGDIGGTKAHVAWFVQEGSTLRLQEERRVPTAQYPGLEAMIQEFIAGHAFPISGACFGVAAPVIDGRSQLVNLP